MGVQNVQNVYGLINNLEFEVLFEELVLAPADAIKKYEREKAKLEKAFKRLEGTSLEKGVKYLDTFYHRKNVKDHCQEAHDLASRLANEVYRARIERGELKPELAANLVRYVEWAAIAHDVAKSVFPREFLDDSVKLRGKDLEFVKAHPIISYMLLKDIPQLYHLLPIVLYHGEFYAGGGPVERFVNKCIERLSEQGRMKNPGYVKICGEQIPLGARVLAIADAYASMIRRNKSERAIKARFRQKSGEEFDPELVDVCFKVLAQLNSR